MGASLTVSDKVSNSTKTLFLAVAAAIVVHGLMLLIKFSTNTLVAKSQQEGLIVSLLTEEIDLKEKADKVDLVSQELPEEKPTQTTESLLLISPQTAISKIKNKEVQGKPLTVSALDIKAWANSDANKFIDEQSRPRLSGLRKDSYEQRLLDPNRIDQRTSPTIDKMSTEDGVIHMQKVRGRTVCGLDSSRNVGDAFNGLDLTPLSGFKKSYTCGDTQRTNLLLDEKGKIKNSDSEKWSIDD